MLSGFAPDGGGTRFFPTMWMAGSFMTVLPNETVNAELDTWTDYALKPPGVDGKLGIAGLS
jgi:carboxymethylenebutenolidase